MRHFPRARPAQPRLRHRARTSLTLTLDDNLEPARNHAAPSAASVPTRERAHDACSRLRLPTEASMMPRCRGKRARARRTAPAHIAPRSSRQITRAPSRPSQRQPADRSEIHLSRAHVNDQHSRGARWRRSCYRPRRSGTSGIIGTILACSVQHCQSPASPHNAGHRETPLFQRDSHQKSAFR
jgi:hypothetical protein